MKIKFFLIAVLALFVQIELQAQQKTNLELTDLFDLEYISDPQISPDGMKVIYARNFKDIMTDRDYGNLWMVNIDGSQNRPLTQGNQRDFSPVWSPDGSKIAYRSNGQDERVKLFVLYLDTRESVALTNSANAPGSVTWSPDGQSLAFTQFVPKAKKSMLTIPGKPQGAEWNEPPIFIDELNYRSDGAGYLPSGKSQIFTIGLSGGRARQRTFEDKNYGSPIWSADGKTLFFSANLNEDLIAEPANSEIHQLDLSDGSIKTLTDRFGPDSNPVLSPDGKMIAYTGNDDSFQGYQVTNLYIMNTDGSGVKNPMSLS
jgi:acylaminoacyl-peptidase